jgi:endonuclease-8
MPEGDTIYRSARALDKALRGRVVTAFRAEYAQLAAADDQSPVAGHTVERVEARGKWLLIHFTNDLVLLTHMLMSGSWHLYRTGEKWQLPARRARLVLETDKFVAVGFDVPVAEFHTTQSLARHRAVPNLGPDVLAETFSEDNAMQRIAAQKHEEIGNVLLDQRVLAGLGNVYKSEVCFAAKVHPFRKVATLSAAELADIAAFARRYMKANITSGSSGQIVTYTGMRRTTGSSDEDARLWVYGRRSSPCRRCGTPIESRKQGLGARTTFWCPQCQPISG